MIIVQKEHDPQCKVSKSNKLMKKLSDISIGFTCFLYLSDLM